MYQPLVSIIIPCFNSEGFVSETIESALNQTYTKTEILLIDNNSTDNTLNILKNIQARNQDRIRVFEEKRKGAPAARNKGLAEAKGDWVQFLDSDDILLPEKILNQVSLISPSFNNIVVGNYRIKKGIFSKKVKYETDAWVGLLTGKLGNTCANLWNRQTLHSLGGWDENRLSSQEYWLIFKMLKSNSSVLFSSPFNTVVINREESISKSSDPLRLHGIFEANYELKIEIFNYITNNQIVSEKHKTALSNYLFRLLIWSKYKCPTFYFKYNVEISKGISFFGKWQIISKEEMRRLLLKILGFIKAIYS